MISDVSLLCEAAVSIVAAAYVLSTLNSEKILHQIYLLPGATSIVDGQVTETRKGSVPIILDISQADWEFVCLSGAFQRIVMNLVGNSLKFTDSGFIQIHLTMKPLDGDGEHGNLQQGTLKREVVLSVRDSGKGIGSDFLKNMVFRPFSQESVLDPGTGMYHNFPISTYARLTKSPFRTWFTYCQKPCSNAQWHCTHQITSWPWDKRHCHLTASEAITWPRIKGWQTLYGGKRLWETFCQCLSCQEDPH